MGKLRPLGAGATGIAALLVFSTLALPGAAADTPSFVEADPMAFPMAIGTTATLSYRVMDHETCPLGPTRPVTLDVLPSAGLGVFPSQLTFTSCGTWKTVTVSANSLGTVLIHLQASASGGFFVDTSGAAVEVVVHVAGDPHPPILTTAPDQTVEAVGPGGAFASVWASAVDPVQGSISGAVCTPSGPIFPINQTGPGRTYVSCRVEDSSGNVATGGFWVTVVDTTPPALPALSGRTVEAAPNGSVSWSVPDANDLVSLQVPLACVPASGATLVAGVHTVACTATDRHGNVASGASFTLRVVDVHPPSIVAPDMTATTGSPGGATVPFSPTVTDANDPSPTVSCSPAAGSLFPVGETSVRCEAHDASGNVAAATFRVTVVLVDDAPPVLALPADATLEATGPGGTIHSYSASATDVIDGPLPVSCTFPSGGTFPLGQTIVTCAATDAAGNVGIGTFRITVRDTTPPSLVVPSGIFYYGAQTLVYEGSASDVADPAPSLVCTPPSGTPVTVGLLTVTCTATDASGNVATSSFGVEVAPTPAPVMDAHPPVVIDVWSGLGTGEIAYEHPEAFDYQGIALDVVCDPDIGTELPLGDHVVTCTATDDLGQTTTGTFLVTLREPPRPTIAPMENVEVRAASADGYVLSFVEPSATDGAGEELPVVCDPASGSLFPVGRTRVTCSATDELGRVASTSFRVSVLFTAPPTIGEVDPIVAEATGPDGAKVRYDKPKAQDDRGKRLAVSCTPASRTIFPLGETLVTCSATDRHGQTATTTFAVTVVDTTPPKLRLPETLTLQTGVGGRAVLSFDASARDVVSGEVPLVCDPAQGALLAPGSHGVTCTATDAAGNVASGSFRVKVLAAPECNADGWQQPGSSRRADRLVAKAGSVVQLRLDVACEPRCDGDDDDEPLRRLPSASRGRGGDEGRDDDRDDDNDDDRDDCDESDRRGKRAVQARFYFAKLRSDGSHGLWQDAESPQDRGNLLETSLPGKHQFQWQTKGLAKGDYVVGVDLGEGDLHTKRIRLR